MAWSQNLPRAHKPRAQMARGQIQLAQSPLQQIQGGQYNTIKHDTGWAIQYNVGARLIWTHWLIRGLPNDTETWLIWMGQLSNSIFLPLKVCWHCFGSNIQCKKNTIIFFGQLCLANEWRGWKITIYDICHNASNPPQYETSSRHLCTLLF